MKLSFRTFFATSLFVCLLCATNAQAIPMGAWNSDRDDDGGGSGGFLAQIFEGHAWTRPGESEPQGRLFGGLNLGGINLGSIVESTREWFEAHHILVDSPDIRPHRGGGLTPVPEPTAALLFAVGVGVVATRRRI